MAERDKLDIRKVSKYPDIKVSRKLDTRQQDVLVLIRLARQNKYIYQHSVSSVIISGHSKKVVANGFQQYN